MQVLNALLRKFPEHTLKQILTILPSILRKLVDARSSPLIISLLSVCCELVLVDAKQLLDYLVQTKVPGSSPTHDLSLYCKDTHKATCQFLDSTTWTIVSIEKKQIGKWLPFSRFTFQDVDDCVDIPLHARFRHHFRNLGRQIIPTLQNWSIHYDLEGKDGINDQEWLFQEDFIACKICASLCGPSEIKNSCLQHCLCIHLLRSIWFCRHWKERPGGAFTDLDWEATRILWKRSDSTFLCSPFFSSCHQTPCSHHNSGKVTLSEIVALLSS